MSISLTALLALLCIILGFVSGFAKESLLFPALVWFVAAIAFNTFGGGPAWQIGGKGKP
jgi:hypothetical protein